MQNLWNSADIAIVGIGNTFCYSGYQGSYIRAFITNAYGETNTQPISFKDKSLTTNDYNLNFWSKYPEEIL